MRKKPNAADIDGIKATEAAVKNAGQAGAAETVEVDAILLVSGGPDILKDARLVAALFVIHNPAALGLLRGKAGAGQAETGNPEQQPGRDAGKEEAWNS